ncbi:MAG: right-handed parallel beta-helix repeat-containing protein [Chloroflexota bacterium]
MKTNRKIWFAFFLGFGIAAALFITLYGLPFAELDPQAYVPIAVRESDLTAVSPTPTSLPPTPTPLSPTATPLSPTATPLSPTATPLSPTPTPNSSGATYYVAISGSDSSDGSSAAPWRTIQYAVEQVAPGDTIIVRAGIYAGARIEQSGTAVSWLTLQADGNVILKSPGPNNRHDSILELETWEGSGSVNYWIIDGFEVTGAPGWGIDMRGSEESFSHHLIIRNNRVHNNGWPTTSSGIFTAYVDDIIIENNESYNNGEHGIYLSNSGDRPLVRGNQLYENANCGLHINGDIAFGDDGTISDGIVERNIIFENGTGGCSGINMDSVTHTIVRNNLLYENHAGGIAIFRISGAVCSNNNRILNNTIVQAENGRWAINIIDFLGDGSQCANNEIINNILYNRHSFRGSISLQQPNIPGFVSDHNVVMDRFTVDSGNSVLTLAEWQALGHDANSLIATPADLFANVAAHDYQLSENSPAIDQGLSLPDVVNDLLGNGRPVGNDYDIGAYEK